MHPAANRNRTSHNTETRHRSANEPDVASPVATRDSTIQLPSTSPPFPPTIPRPPSSSSVSTRYSERKRHSSLHDDNHPSVPLQDLSIPPAPPRLSLSSIQDSRHHHDTAGDTSSHLTEAVAPESPNSASMNSDSGRPPRPTSFTRATSSYRIDGSPYGSFTPSRDVSPTRNTKSSRTSHQLRHVSDSTNRSELSKLSSAASQRSASQRSTQTTDDLEGAVLVSGLEGRFGVAEASFTQGALSEDNPDKHNRPSSVPSPSHDDENSTTSSDDNDYVEDSPHELVRASVPPTDDTSLSINTPRMWFLSILFSILGSSTNLFFSLRYPSVAITPVIALLLVHPLGLLWDYMLKRSYDPHEEFVDGKKVPSGDGGLSYRKRRHRWRLWLAQGQWNEKEHTCVYVSSNVAFGFAFATDVIVEQTQFYDQDAPIAYQLLLTISTQVLGYGFAGLTRRILVRPSGMIWPGTLMSAAMFSTLHKQENKPADGWRISRWKFFYIVWAGAFAFYFLPGLLMPALSYFSVITWFAPQNVVISNLFGVSSGLGLFPITFDWAQITYVGSPLLVPFWAAVNVMGGLAIIMWIIAPIFYYSNVLYSAYMPILSSSVFDNTGSVYDVARILTPDLVFDRDAYQGYSRVFLPATYVLSYGVQFAGLAALLTHTVCWHGSDIWTAWRKAWKEMRDEKKATYQPLHAGASSVSVALSEDAHSRGSRSTSRGRGEMGQMFKEDIHNRLMRRYHDAPLTWYLVTFASMAAVGIFIVEYYPIHLPWYGLLLALALGAIFFIPNGIIMAVTNQHSSIYLICQLICGALFPGRPIANMVFVTYGYISSAQGIKFSSDLKLGHYMKIPPRILFSVQLIATLVSSVTQIGVLNWMFANVRGLCTSSALNGFTCPIARVHFNGSILWGVVGPGEFFGPGALYRWLVWFFPIGAILPIPLWLYSRRRRWSKLRKVNFPVMFGAMSWIPPATGLNFSVWALVCFVFNFVIKRRANAWWSKYTMTMSAALDSGLAFGILVVFFGFVYPGWMDSFSWWGTEVYKKGCDWQACAYRTLKQGERFGPETW